jgi:hypothetical protein
MMQRLTDRIRRRPGTSQGLRAKLTTRRNIRVTALVAVAVLFGMMIMGWSSTTTTADAGTAYVSAVTFPFNGTWLDGTSGGHYWDEMGGGFCRIDADPASATAFSVNAATCDIQSKAATQSVVGPQQGPLDPDAGMYYVYQADMGAGAPAGVRSPGAPLRVTFDPAADGGQGLIVPGSEVALGGLNTVGYFGDATKSFLSAGIALGPCRADIPAPCLAAYVAFRRSVTVVRINNVDKDSASQSIERVSETIDPPGVRFGIAMFKNLGGTSDLYLGELGGIGVSMVANIAGCHESPANVGTCLATPVGGIATNAPQGMVVQKDSLGNDKYIYVGDAPDTSTATILRYNPATGVEDVVSSAVTPYDSLLNPGQLISTYTFTMGLGINPHNGDLFVGDDPSFAFLNPPLNKGHIFRIAGVGGFVAVDCAGCAPPVPPSTTTPLLYAYGLTAPKGGSLIVPSADGAHMWAADHSQGFCRMDVVTAAPGLHAYAAKACDDGSVLGSGGQAVYDDTNIAPAAISADCPVAPAGPPVDGVFDLLPQCGNPGGTLSLHYIYVTQNDVLSPGIIRFTYDPTADGGAGMLVANSGVVMAPNAGIGGAKANAAALGPCKAGFPTCKHALYVSGLSDPFIRRINNPEDAPNTQVVDVVAHTFDGRGTNGSVGMLGDDLYIPENSGFTVLKNASQCPVLGVDCATRALPIGTFGITFAAAMGVDPNRGAAGTVYASASAGIAAATIFQYDVASNTARVYATRGQMPPAGTAEATVWCTTTCTRPIDPAQPPGGLAAFRFAQGLVVDDNGNVYIAEDAFAGARGGRGHLWVAPYLAFPPAPPVPAPVVTSFTPTSGGAGVSVTITGANFTSATGVSFNGDPVVNVPVAATNFTVVSDTSITTVVPAGATTGTISVTSPTGTGTSLGAFTVITVINCNVTVSVPGLAGGMTYWVQFTAHNTGTLSATWTTFVPQSTQLIMYAGNPFAGNTDPVAKGPTGGAIASLNTKTTTNLSINAGSRPAGTYTVQFFNGANSMPKTTGTISYVNTSGFPCPAPVPPATGVTLNIWP